MFLWNHPMNLSHLLGLGFLEQLTEHFYIVCTFHMFQEFFHYIQCFVPSQHLFFLSFIITLVFFLFHSHCHHPFSFFLYHSSFQTLLSCEILVFHHILHSCQILPSFLLPLSFLFYSEFILPNCLTIFLFYFLSLTFIFRTSVDDYTAF